jgi:hypothetical protein
MKKLWYLVLFTTLSALASSSPLPNSDYPDIYRLNYDAASYITRYLSHKDVENVKASSEQLDYIFDYNWNDPTTVLYFLQKQLDADTTKTKELTEMVGNMRIAKSNPEVAILLVKYHHMKGLQQLIELGTPKGTLQPALDIAFNWGIVNMTGPLIDAGLDLKGEWLSYAAERGCLPIVQKLIERGLDIHYNEDLALRRAIQGKANDVASYLIEQGANVRALGDAAINDAARAGSLELLKKIVSLGGDIQANEGACLTTAVEYNRPDIVTYLLNEGAGTNSTRRQAVRRGIMMRSYESLEILFRNGIDINLYDGEALSTAAETANEKMVLMLLRMGADVHAGQDNALLVARDYRTEDLLLAHGANPDVLVLKRTKKRHNMSHLS